jgi:hypothetical protein
LRAFAFQLFGTAPARLINARRHRVS